MYRPIRLHESRKRFVLLPIQYPRIWTCYKRSIANFWVVDPFTFPFEREEWSKETPFAHKQAFKRALESLTASYQLFSSPLESQISEEFKALEARSSLGYRLASRNIHTELFWTFISSFFDEEEPSTPIGTPINSEEAAKIAWTRAFSQTETACNNVSLAEKLIALITVEQLFSASLIAFVDWMDDTSQILSAPLSKIYNDNENHIIFLLVLLGHLPVATPKERIATIILEGVALEKACANASPFCRVGFQAKDVETYIEFLADRLLTDLGIPSYFNAKNPFHFARVAPEGYRRAVMTKDIDEASPTFRPWSVEQPLSSSFFTLHDD